MLLSKVKVIVTNTLHLLYSYTLKTQWRHYKRILSQGSKKTKVWSVSVSRHTSAAAPCTVCYQASQGHRKPWAHSRRMRTRTKEKPPLSDRCGACPQLTVFPFFIVGKDTERKMSHLHHFQVQFRDVKHLHLVQPSPPSSPGLSSSWQTQTLSH